MIVKTAIVNDASSDLTTDITQQTQAQMYMFETFVGLLIKLKIKNHTLHLLNHYHIRESQ